jgi:hypothetical protein
MRLYPRENIAPLVGAFNSTDGDVDRGARNEKTPGSFPPGAFYLL